MNTARVLEYPADAARAHREAQVLDAKRQGWDDRKAGQYLGQSPFDAAAQVGLWMAWRAGWHMAKRGEVRP
jgi:hypothetical protein